MKQQTEIVEDTTDTKQTTTLRELLAVCKMVMNLGPDDDLLPVVQAAQTAVNNVTQKVVK